LSFNRKITLEDVDKLIEENRMKSKTPENWCIYGITTEPELGAPGTLSPANSVFSHTIRMKPQTHLGF
jgi:hypothetical protein